MKRCSICGIVKSKTFICKKCNSTVCLSCFDFTKWICFTCREREHREEYSNSSSIVLDTPKIALSMFLLIIFILSISPFAFAIGEDMNTSLLAYFPLDGYTTSNDTHTYDASWKTTSGTLETSANCKIGTCYSFSKAGTNYLITANYNMGATPDFTHCGWYNFNQSGLLLGMATHENYNLALGKTATDVYRVRSYSGSEKILTCSTNHTRVNAFYFVCVVASGGNAWVYQNATLECSGALATATGNAPLGIGEAYTSADGLYSMQGFIDEVGFWTRNLTQKNITYLYNNGLGCAYPFINCGGASDTVYLTYSQQKPSDITSLNILPSGLNISFNITANNGVNNATVRLYTKTNNSRNDYLEYRNGSISATGFYPNGVFINSSSNFTWVLSENDVYPHTENLDVNQFQTNIHTQNTFSTLTAYKDVLYNVSNNSAVGFYELMTNSTSSASNLEVYYCNSSYSSGNYKINSNCLLFCTKTATTSYNHNHSIYSSHQVCPFNLINGKLAGTIGVTSNSSFITDVTGGLGTWSIWTLPNQTRIDCFQSSANSGTSWSSQVLTLDSHLHQYSGDETFYYLASACSTTGTCTNSTQRSDFINYVDLPPTSPIVTRPNSTDVFNSLVNITYTNGTPNSPNVLYNNSIDLLNGSLVFQQNIVKNTTNTTYIFNSALISTGTYIIRVQSCDNASLCSYGFSSTFWIDNTKPSIIPVSPEGDNSTSFYNSGIINLTIQFTDSRDLFGYNVTINHTNGTTFYSKTNSISGTSYTMSESVDTTSFENDTDYRVWARVCDSHTSNIISPATSINKTERELLFNFKGTEIKIASVSGDELSTSYVKLDDRYSFSFEYSKILTEKHYILTSSEHITYLPNSKYRGHFVVNNYWIDFEGIGDVIVDEPIENEFHITVKSSGTKAVFNSIGELNCNTLLYTFYLTKTAPSGTPYGLSIITLTNWFNTDALDITTTSGVLVLFFLFFVWVALIIMTEFTKVPIIGLLTSLYGFFLGFLFFTSISSILGLSFILINIFYIIRSVLLAYK